MDWWSDFQKRYNNNQWMMWLNIVGLIYNVFLFGFITVIAFLTIVFFVPRPWSMYPAIFWGAWVVAGTLHATIVFHYPSGRIDNILAISFGLIGGTLGGLSWGYYWSYWLNCFFNESDLNAIQLDQCLEANWLVMMMWICALLVTIGGTAVAGISLGNYIFSAASKRIEKRRKMGQN